MRFHLSFFFGKVIDIKSIKYLLEYLSIKTTEKYLHVKKELLVNILMFWMN